MTSTPTTTLAMYSQIVRTDGTTSIAIPDASSLIVPKAVVAISGKLKDHRRVVVPKRTPTSPQPDPTLLWKWQAGMPLLASALARIRGDSGFVWIAVVTDKPTSDTDLTPLGTHRHASYEGLPCSGEFKRTSPWALGHATQSVAAGIDGDGFPAAMTDEGSVDCAIYEIWARANSTEADVELDVFIDG